MIPITEIIDANIYSQDDAGFLLGSGFTKKAARETIRSACQNGQLESSFWRKRWWFTGHQSKLWVLRCSGAEVKVPVEDHASPIAQVVASG